MILALAAFLRLYRFDSLPPGLYADEAINGVNALQALDSGQFHVFYPDNNGREGLYIDLAALPIHFFGNRIWALRRPAAVFGILTVAGIYFLGAELLSAPAGLLAAFFVATSFWHMLFSREAFRSIATPCLFTWALFLLMTGLRRRNAAVLAIAGMVYGLGFYTYIAFRATPLLIAAVLVRRKTIAAPFLVAAALTAAPLIAYFVSHPASFTSRAAQVSVLNSPRPAIETAKNAWRTARMLFTRGDYNWRHNYAWQAEVFWPVALLFVIGIALTLVRRCPKGGLLLAWLVLGALPAVLSAENIPHAMRSILMIPPVFLLAAIGAQWLWRWLASRVPRRGLEFTAGAMLIALAYEPYHTYFDRWAVNPNVPRFFDADAVEVARQINSLPPEVDAWVITPPADPMRPEPVRYLTWRRSRTHFVASDSCEAIADARVFCLSDRR